MSRETWESLLASEGWRELRTLVMADRMLLVDRLIAVSMESSDPTVRGVASEIRSMDMMLLKPEQEAEASIE